MQWPIFRVISRVAKDVQFHFRSMALANANTAAKRNAHEHKI